MYEFTHRLPHAPLRKPSKNEEEYFHRRDFEARRARARERERRRDAEEADELRARHEGRCPRCGVPLERLRVREIRADQCPVCHGVWLDEEHFEALTHRRTGPLADLFRDALLQHSLGGIERARDEAAPDA